jgi:hypothetical protein
MKRVLRWFRGVLGNALAWGIGWLVVGAGFGAYSAVFHSLPWRLVPAAALMVAAIGAGFGATFAAFISANFRGRSVEELNPLRFALGGALITIPFTLVFGAAVESWKGWIFFADLIAPVGTVALLGGLTAYGTVKLARKALPPGASTEEIESGSESKSKRLASTST